MIFICLFLFFSGKNTLCEIYLLNQLSVQCSIVMYRPNVVKKVSRTSCINYNFIHIDGGVANQHAGSCAAAMNVSILKALRTK